MHCGNCGREVSENAYACPGCGCDPRKGGKFCAHCAAPLSDGQIVCLKCGMAVRPAEPVEADQSTKSRTIYILLAVLLEQIVCCQVPFHNFYAGRTNMAAIQTCVWVFSVVVGCCFGTILISWPIMFIWYAIEACLVKTDGRGRRLR